MPSISDLTIINSNTAEARRVESGTEVTLCSPGFCGSKNLTVYKRTIFAGRRLDVLAANEYHLVYVIATPTKGIIRFNNQLHDAEEGAGVLLGPSESARFEASGSNLELLHMIVPKPPAAVEAGLPGGPGYFFNRQTLRALSDASGGRVRRFFAGSSVRLRGGKRLTPTNAIQAGEMHYKEGGSSPYHLHPDRESTRLKSNHGYNSYG